MSEDADDRVSSTAGPPGAGLLLHQVRAALPGLRRAEAKVARVVLDEPQSLLESPIAEIARRAGVSEPTVIRFCRSLGFSGFQRFRVELAQSLAASVPYVFSGIGADEDMAELSTKVIDRSMATLLQTRQHLDVQRLEAAVDLLDAASRIEFYGQGASGLVAADAQHKFFRLGAPTVAYSDPHVHGMAASILTADAVVVAISHTGCSTDLIHSAETALANGARVIGITAAGSPLAACCTVTLAAEVHEDTDVYTPMMSRMAHLAILDVLAIGVALRRGDAAVQRLRRTKLTLADTGLRGRTPASGESGPAPGFAAIDTAHTNPPRGERHEWKKDPDDRG